MVQVFLSSFQGSFMLDRSRGSCVYFLRVIVMFNRYFQDNDNDEYQTKDQKEFIK